MKRSARDWVRSAFQSLAARVSFFVFAATLTSALAVAWTSAYALRAFLRSKVEQKIPAAVMQMRDRLDLWYAQRTLDVQVFARSAIVVDGLARARRGDGDEVEQYLRYVLQGLPQYRSLFVLDAQGERILEVGEPAALAPEVLRRLARAEDGEISGMLADPQQGPVQTVSSAVRAREGREVATLHAVLPRAALDRYLAEAGKPHGDILVVDATGTLVTSTDGRERAPEPIRSLLGSEPGVVLDYVGSDGVRVVGSALGFPRLHWTLVVEEDYEAAFAPLAAILGRTVALNLGIVLALSGLAFGVVRVMVRPLHALSDCARRLRDGEQEVPLPVVSRADEVGVLARSFAEMVGSLRRAREVLEQLAITDGLTKIHNHRFFQDQLAREIKRSERTGEPLSLVLVDIDDFKALNDRFGHAVGDAVLEALAGLLVEQTRDQDLVARYGGEEFAILAPGTDHRGALVLAEKIHTAVGSAHFLAGSQKLAITVSAGVAVYHGDREAFFHEADRALYAAKGAGKDCVVAAKAAGAR
jgi:diguanylate cyclase (GGDEF)-like protein